MSAPSFMHSNVHILSIKFGSAKKVAKKGQCKVTKDPYFNSPENPESRPESRGIHLRNPESRGILKSRKIYTSSFSRQLHNGKTQ